MLSSSFAHLADDDLAAIIAYVRSVPFDDTVLPETSYGLVARVMLLAGRFDLQPKLINGDGRPGTAPDREDARAFGEYLAASTCTECHGADLTGTDGFMTTPSLALAAGYSLDEFKEFLRTGVAAGGRRLPIMSDVARARFAHLDDEEIDALYRYLEALARQEGSAASAAPSVASGPHRLAARPAGVPAARHAAGDPQGWRRGWSRS